MGIDFNSADVQSNFDLLPVGIYSLSMMIRNGLAGQGEDAFLTASKSSDAMFLNCEFTVMAGAFAKRKFFSNFVLSGGKTDDSDQSIAGKISRATLRAILESARNIMPSDMSQAAMAQRIIKSYGDFNGMNFLAKVGIEKSKDAQYQDKNRILAVITPDKAEYNTFDPGTAPPVAQAAKASPRPAWAQ